MPNTCAVILAGGEGKRMKSNLPKTMSLILNKPMLSYIIDALHKSNIQNICVVTGFKKECVEEYLAKLPYHIDTVFQSERLGTGHAVMMAKNFLKQNKGDVVILNGDAPFMDSKTITNALNHHDSTNSCATVISARVKDPTGYGRIVRNQSDNSLQAIVEQKDADEKTLKIDEVNSGGFWFDTVSLLSVLDKIKSDNNAKEYYLPDAIKLLLKEAKPVSAYIADSPDTVLGANDPEQLAELNEIAKTKV